MTTDRVAPNRMFRALLGFTAADRYALELVQEALDLMGKTPLAAQELRRWLDEGRPVTLLDTRKTLPGLRVLEKYATRMGGAMPTSVTSSISTPTRCTACLSWRTPSSP